MPRFFPILFALLASAFPLLAAVPTIKVSRLHNTGYNLYWGPLPEGVDQARLEVRAIKPKNAPFGTHGTFSGTRGGSFITNLTPGQVMEWRLVLLRGGQAETGTPLRVTATKFLGPEGGPQNWREVSASGNRVEITWDDTATKETAYVIYRRDEFFETPPVEVRLPKNSTRYVDNTALPGKNYFYTIAAVNKKGPGFLTYELYVRVPTSDALPNREPQPATATTHGTGIKVTWTPDSGGNVDGYSIQRRIGYGGFWFEVGRTPYGASEFIDTVAGISPSAEYRAVPFNTNGVGENGNWNEPQASPYPPGHPSFQEPVVDGSMIHLLDPSGRKIQRFDAAAGQWQAPLELKIPAPAYQFELAPDGIYLGVKGQLYRMEPAAGESHFLAAHLGRGKLLSQGGNIFLRGGSYLMGITPKVGPGITYATVTEAARLDETRLLFRQGSEAVFSGENLGSSGLAVSRDQFASLPGNPSNRSPKIHGNPARVFAVSGGSLLLTNLGQLTVEGDSTAPPFAGIGKTGIRAALSLSNGGNAILTATEIVLYDRWWNLDSTHPAAQAVTLCEAAGKLWAVAPDSSATNGWALSPIHIAPISGDSAFWTSPIPPDGLETGETGGQILVHRASGTWRKRPAGSSDFGPPRSAERGIIDWEYDPVHDALLTLRSGGLITRHGLTSETADWQRALSGYPAFMVLAGSNIEFPDGSGLTRSGAYKAARGYWLHRPIYTTWDPVSSRLHYQTAANELRGLDYANGATIYPPRGLRNEAFTGLLRISPDRTRVVFGGGFMATYPHFNPLFQLPLNVTDAAWRDQQLVVTGIGPSGQHLLASFDASGRMNKAFTLPGEALHVTSDGDGWIIIHRMPGGGWRMLRGDAVLSTFTILGGLPGSMPVATTLPAGSAQFPLWYEDSLMYGTPGRNGFSAVQNYMMGRYDWFTHEGPIQIYQYEGRTYFKVRRRNDVTLDPFRVAIEYSPDLANWTENIPTELFDIQHSLVDPNEVETYSFSPKSNTTKAYFRLRFVGPVFDQK